MGFRKYSKCLWCGRAIDTTNSDRELCDYCSQFSSFAEMVKAKQFDIGKHMSKEQYDRETWIQKYGKRKGKLRQ